MPAQSIQHLITGDTDPFLPHLIHAINQATHIDITVSFIRATGFRLLENALQEALAHHVKIRVLTGDYLYITDVYALRGLMLLKDRGADVRIFESKGRSFHMKAYIFVQQQQRGCAFIGSSNISNAALKNGHEWNLKVEQAENTQRFSEIRQKFDTIFNHPQSNDLTHEWIDAYQQKIKDKPTPITTEIGANETVTKASPNIFQQEALNALRQQRNKGYQRGLVVMATGIGKTWLAAFDTEQVKAKRILFVAHREEILNQAEETFIRINPLLTIGRYTGKEKKIAKNNAIVFASIQTLGRKNHLNNFAKDHFDYLIVDEFHHAAARSYQHLLNHFEPDFLLGLTATPERTDQADILSLCDNNLVYRRDLFDGIEANLLCPFHYKGIADEHVDYQAIKWRNGKFDPNQLLNQLATHARAKQTLQEWKTHKQQRTLAFCMSQKHADFMAIFFSKKGYKAASVHSQSAVRRNDALTQLKQGALEIIFSVDLFNEGVDLPTIDTVMMLRPTDSKIIFLQQLGRGLRTHKTKEKLVVLDFIGNHISFFRKPEALFSMGSSKKDREDFIHQVKNNTLTLPQGCYVNYDLQSIDFMSKLLKGKTNNQVAIYQSLKESKGRRPTLTEFYQAEGKLVSLKKKHQHWLGFVAAEDDLSNSEKQCIDQHAAFFKHFEVTALTKAWKLLVLEAMIELNGFNQPPTTEQLAQQSYKVLQRHPPLLDDLPKTLQQNHTTKKWHTYWLNNPINAWIGGNTAKPAFFKLENQHFIFTNPIDSNQQSHFYLLLQEIIDYKLLQYERRAKKTAKEKIIKQLPTSPTIEITKIPYFENLKIACGHFKNSYQEDDILEQKGLPPHYGKLDPSKHFIARASGNSMNGGKHPIVDGDYLLLEIIGSNQAGSISNQILAIERGDVMGDGQYLLRYVKKLEMGRYELIAHNPDYEPMMANEDMRTFARFKEVIEPTDLL